MVIRKAVPGDLNELQKIFIDSVTKVCRSDYTFEQINAWASAVDNWKRWEDVLTNQFVAVSQDKNILTGFCSLEKDNYGDFLYIHSDYQRRGIATELYIFIENEAKRLYQKEIFSHVSITAKPFFEKAGFHVLKKQKILLKGVELTNYWMKKRIV